MAIYRLPPSPFVGGRQPLAPKDLNPSIEAVEVNDPTPKFSIPVLTAILIAWQPVPSYPQAQKFVPQVTEEQVSFKRQIINYSLDSYYPQLPRKLPVDVTAVPEDNPPPKLSAAILSSIISTWNIPPYPRPQSPVKYVLEFVAEEKVPYSSQIYTILNSWIPIAPQRIQYPKLYQEYIPDNPPIGRRVLWLNTILDAWIPPPPQPWNPNAHVIPPAGNNIIIWMWKRTA